MDVSFVLLLSFRLRCSTVIVVEKRGPFAELVKSPDPHRTQSQRKTLEHFG